MAMELTTGKRQSCTVSDKFIQLAEQNGNCAAEHEFGVSKSNVRLWRKSKENLEKMPRLKHVNHGKTAFMNLLSLDDKRSLQRNLISVPGFCKRGMTFIFILIFCHTQRNTVIIKTIINR